MPVIGLDFDIFYPLYYVLQISCGLDSQFCGMVEAWASGLTWREIMMDCAMDEGDLARLLRRTIDLLSQVCILFLDNYQSLEKI